MPERTRDRTELRFPKPRNLGPLVLLLIIVIIGWGTLVVIPAGHRGGHVTPLLYTASVYRDSVGAIMGVSESARDITRRRAAESAMRESETRHRVLVEQMPAIAYVRQLDEAMICSYISPRVRAVLGFEETDFVTNPGFWFDQIHPDDGERVSRAKALLSRHGSRKSFQAKDWRSSSSPWSWGKVSPSCS
jgi:PAS domain-containing protein